MADDPGRVAQAVGKISVAGIDGVGPLMSAEDLAAKYQRRYPKDPEQAIRRLMKVETRKCGATGFLTSLGGFVTLPVALPANIIGAAIIEARMVATIALLRGWDTKDPTVRLFVQACLVGQAGVEALKEAGIKLAQQGLEHLAHAAGQKVLAKVVAKVGAQALGKAPGKAVPLVGGLVGLVVDAAVCRSIAVVAKDQFHPVAA